MTAIAVILAAIHLLCGMAILDRTLKRIAAALEAANRQREASGQEGKP